ncbi:MAG TPA: lytic transglycosylase domain-containing protein [Thermoanaerobaculia bacterium]|jgi:soluble lytic murein transglycosylase-like protein|nr:lytic transglycosylase domain-containing protein [Thermoanaerobaculia bacterium]
MRARRRWVVAVAAVLVPVLIVVGVLRVRQTRAHHREFVVPAKPEAPPDLEKLRPAFTAGLDAVHRRDGAEAVKQLSSFQFGKRTVDEYRMYYLANAYQLAGDAVRARNTLADLLSRHPAFVHFADAGMSLGGLYAATGDWRHAADAYAAVATKTDDSNAAASARWSAVDSRFAHGDIAAVLYDARSIAIKNPRSPQAVHALELTRAITGAPMKFTAAERLERAVSFLRDGDAQNAFDELALLEANGVPADLRMPMMLNRGLALNQLRRFEDSNKVLEPLAKGPYRFAIPAIFTAAKNYGVLSASINPNVTKTIVVRQQVGTTKVRAKGKKKATTRPRFAKVKKNIQLVDLAKKSKKDEYDGLATERLKDLLSLPLADDVRIQVLNSLIERAEAKNQDDYERQLIEQLAKFDPSQEAGLQHFWDKAWAAYARGDLNGARELLAFIRDNYRNPNTRRQSMYWFARCGDRLGRKAESDAIYHELASAPYDDIYAIESEKRGAKRQPTTINPLTSNRMDWPDIAEHNMPKELRLGYELTALSDFPDAQQEIAKNRNRKNQQFADALMADLYHASGNMLDTLKTLRLAFPALATVEQDSVPPYFLRMYYPLKYEDWIRKYSDNNGVDRFTIMGLIHQESYFNPKAKSGVGATGLMQLMPATGRELAGRFHITPHLDNPETNIRLGTAHFKMLVNLFNGSNELAIASYNAGQGRVMQWRRAAPGKPMDEFIEAIPFRETRTYVKHVVMLASTYRRMYP